jgi:hypothetical protein
MERIKELLKEFEQLVESEDERERKYYAHGRFQLYLHKLLHAMPSLFPSRDLHEQVFN